MSAALAARLRSGVVKRTPIIFDRSSMLKGGSTP
jgi:hypothetical protein